LLYRHFVLAGTAKDGFFFLESGSGPSLGRMIGLFFVAAVASVVFTTAGEFYRNNIPLGVPMCTATGGVDDLAFDLCHFFVL